MKPYAALLSVLLAGPAAAHEGVIVFTRFGSVFQQPADGSAKAAEIAELPDDATEVRWAEPIDNGHLVVLDFGTYPIWLYAPDPTQPVQVRSGGNCTGKARPSPGGGCLVCATNEGVKLVAGGFDDESVLPPGLTDVSFLGPSGMELAGLSDEGVVAFDRTDPTRRRVLAQPGPRSHLLFSPDGKRGVAVFGTGDDARIKSFVLDGKGVPRQLGGPGFPTAWSWDSTWILFQEGDIKDAPGDDDGDGGSAFLLQSAPRRGKARGGKGRKKPAARPAESTGPLVRACVGRATGGEVKCWESYTGLGFSPDSRLVLLKKGTTLYAGKIAGVKPAPPEKLLENVDGAAAWVPSPIAVPLPPPEAQP